MSEKLQVTVPDNIAERWRYEAEALGMSLSQWVVSMVGRPDPLPALREVAERLDQIDSRQQRIGNTILAAVIPGVTAGTQLDRVDPSVCVYVNTPVGTQWCLGADWNTYLDRTRGLDPIPPGQLVTLLCVKTHAPTNCPQPMMCCPAAGSIDRQPTGA